MIDEGEMVNIQVMSDSSITKVGLGKTELIVENSERMPGANALNKYGVHRTRNHGIKSSLSDRTTIRPPILLRRSRCSSWLYISAILRVPA